MTLPQQKMWQNSKKNVKFLKIDLKKV